MLTTVVLIGVVVAPALAADDLRIFEDRFEALDAARQACQPIVLHFYDDTTKTYVGRGTYVSPQERIRLFYTSNERIRDKALKKAVVLLLPMSVWRNQARDLGVMSHEGLASLSPFELAMVDPSSKWGGLVFR